MGKLLDELKRRKIFKVAAVYAVVAWVLIQVVSTVLPTFEAPQWVEQTITFLLILGFPFAMLLTWAYEVTPEDIRADSVVQANQAAPAAQVHLINYVILGIVLLVAGFQVTDRILFNDGQRFIRFEGLNGQPLTANLNDATELTVVENWFDELQRLAPSGAQ